MRRLPALVTLAVLALLGACHDKDEFAGQDPDDGAARLAREVSEVEATGNALSQVLSKALGGRAEPGPARYGFCSSSPVSGLSYDAQWSLRGVDPEPTLTEVTDVVAENGWEIGDTSEPEGFIPETTLVSRAGVSMSVGVDDGDVLWGARTDCVRVTDDDASRLVGPVS